MDVWKLVIVPFLIFLSLTTAKMLDGFTICLRAKLTYFLNHEEMITLESRDGPNVCFIFLTPKLGPTILTSSVCAFSLKANHLSSNLEGSSSFL